ncbi:head-tail connector protein [Alloyangia pacifica]|uniref:Phage gp6-like head-tail connector protein n=1 Tax=Alloyangia pacifica TaxID=311180 RepID=A0A1I6VCV3_9RHOB|nr:head-tail connector protein [Alloyangia pacifica]SDH82712.1 Phage gp6-like head-tail connector protein [Alloyangia pacifica]SFT11558.1 Phage gp6-like head-tail connector protein [Alloyangia pacifica]
MRASKKLGATQSAVSVEELKTQLNLDHDPDVALLAFKIDAAEAYVTGFTGAPIPNPCPAASKQAVLTLASYWYEVCEAARGPLQWSRFTLDELSVVQSDLNYA